MVIPMVPLLDWNIPLPVPDEVALSNTISVRCRGTSGAGQFELAGNSVSPDGNQVSARSLVGSDIQFVLESPGVHDGFIRIEECYPIKDIGGKNRVSIQDADGSNKKPNIGNLFAALFLLPSVSMRSQTRPVDSNELTQNSFWIDEVDCALYQHSGQVWLLKPGRIILATGNKNNKLQKSGACIFDYKDRIRRIYRLCRACYNAPQINVELSTLLSYYRLAIMGFGSFRASFASQFRDNIMIWLTKFDESYDGEQDPLPYLEKLFKVHDVITRPKRDAIREPLNLIYFGAPGTGKSYQLDKLAHKRFIKDHIRRVTFFPDYTYSQFVGSFRPFEEGGKIGYQYVAGPFLKTYLDASLHPYERFLLIVEEINRANPAAVFGDVFQLLDRDSMGASEYSVSVPQEMEKCIAGALDSLSDTCKNDIENFFDPDLAFPEFRESMLQNLSLPPNMYIWATMNSADQGVFPMDTAFKRRWDFHYMGIDEGDHEPIEAFDGMCIDDFVVTVGGVRVRWNGLRKALNNLMRDAHINEDKLLGPFFLAPSTLNDDPVPDGSETVFQAAFKDKVLLYLYEDAGKMHRPALFTDDKASYSELCDQFDSSGVAVFRGIDIPSILDASVRDGTDLPNKE